MERSAIRRSLDDCPANGRGRSFAVACKWPIFLVPTCLALVGGWIWVKLKLTTIQAIVFFSILAFVLGVTLPAVNPHKRRRAITPSRVSGSSSSVPVIQSAEAID